MSRVCLLTDSAAPSGVGAHLLTLAAGMGGDEVTVAARVGSGLLAQAAAQGFAVKVLDDDENDLSRWFERAAPDLVHVHAGIGWEGHAATRAACAAGVPFVRTEHLPYLLTDAAQQAEYSATTGSLARLICVSDAVADGHRAADIGPAQIATVPNGVAPHAPVRPRSALQREWGVGDAPILLMVARFAEQKRACAVARRAAARARRFPRRDRPAGRGRRALRRRDHRPARRPPASGRDGWRGARTPASAFLGGSHDRPDPRSPCRRAPPTSRRPVPRTRIGFVGAGGIAHRHFGVLERLGDVAIVAVADVDFARATEAAARFGARAFDDAAVMVADVELDALYICVPPFAWRARTPRDRAQPAVLCREAGRARSRLMQALRPQGTVIDLAFYQGGADRLRLGEKLHHHGLNLRCAQINRVPRGLGFHWDKSRLANATVDLLKARGAEIEAQFITHVIPYDDAPGFIARRVAERPEFLQIVFKADA